MDFFQKSYELMADNGIGIHRIDLRDHVDFAKPLEFLTLDTHEWDTVRQNALQGHLNRHRMSHYRALLRASGFQILDEFIYDTNSTECVERVRPRLREPFQTCSDEDLFTAGVEFVVRKPDSKSRPPT
jgi:hypothetical protein